MKSVFVLVVTGAEQPIPLVESAATLDEAVKFAKSHVPEARQKDWPDIKKKLETSMSWRDEESGTSMSIRIGRGS
jgi:hypothetical protein